MNDGKIEQINNFTRLKCERLRAMERERNHKFPSNEFDYENGFDKKKKKKIVSYRTLFCCTIESEKD